MIVLSGPWLGASGAACAAPPDIPKMKASARILFILFLRCHCCIRIMAPATSRRKEGFYFFHALNIVGMNQKIAVLTPAVAPPIFHCRMFPAQ
jgi:hypothetical protein